MTPGATPLHPTRGVHVLADLWGCDPRLVDDRSFVVAALRRAAVAARATVLEVSAHRFEPQGVTASALLAESHVSIHTWPEYGYAAVDVMTCGTAMRPRTCVGAVRGQLRLKSLKRVVRSGIAGRVPRVCGKRCPRVRGGASEVRRAELVCADGPASGASRGGSDVVGLALPARVPGGPAEP